MLQGGVRHVASEQFWLLPTSKPALFVNICKVLTIFPEFFCSVCVRLVIENY